jgi:hypothetical protein
MSLLEHQLLIPEHQRTYTALPQAMRRAVIGDVMTKEQWQLASESFYEAVERSTHAIHRKAIFVAPPMDEWNPKVKTNLSKAESSDKRGLKGGGGSKKKRRKR